MIGHGQNLLVSAAAAVMMLNWLLQFGVCLAAFTALLTTYSTGVSQCYSCAQLWLVGVCVCVRFHEPLLCVAGSKDVPVGTPVAWLVEEADELAAFKDITPGGGIILLYMLSSSSKCPVSFHTKIWIDQSSAWCDQLGQHVCRGIWCGRV